MRVVLDWERVRLTMLCSKFDVQAVFAGWALKTLMNDIDMHSSSA